MTPPTFPHAGWCSVHGEYDKPLAKGECTCGADGKREAWNAALDAAQELLRERAERLRIGGKHVRSKAVAAARIALDELRFTE